MTMSMFALVLFVVALLAAVNTIVLVSLQEQLENETGGYEILASTEAPVDIDTDPMACTTDLSWLETEFDTYDLIVDGNGADFVVFENPFVIKGTDGKAVYAETAVVSVAEVDRPDAYQQFLCDSTNPPYVGCAGVVPVRYAGNRPLSQSGGDQFDLAVLGLSRIKYIRIEDTGDNQSFLTGTEGFDLDAIGLIHTAIE